MADRLLNLEAMEHLLTTWDDVAAALKDPRLVKQLHDPMGPGMPEIFQIFGRFFVSLDPPLHTRLRGQVSKTFTPRLMEGMQPLVETTAARLLDEAGPEFDVISAYSSPLAIGVIAHILGMPQYNDFREWSAALSALAEEASPAVIGRAVQAGTQFAEALRGEQPPLLEQLQAQGLSEIESLATCMLLLVAGHETTMNLIANAVLLFLQHPNTWGVEDGLPQAIEEVLRFEPPGRIAYRWAAEDLTLGEHSIRSGDRVALSIAQANRDPRHFHQPDVFNIERTDVKHLSFGLGIHYCMGAPLARLESVVALRALMQRHPHLQLVEDQPLQWQDRPSLRGLVRLPVRTSGV